MSLGSYFGDIWGVLGAISRYLEEECFILSVWFRRGVGKAIIAVPMHLLVLLFWDCCAIVVVLLLDYFVPVLLLVSSSTVWMSPDQLLDAASR